MPTRVPPLIVPAVCTGLVCNRNDDGIPAVQERVDIDSRSSLVWRNNVESVSGSAVPPGGMEY